MSDGAVGKERPRGEGKRESSSLLPTCATTATFQFLSFAAAAAATVPPVSAWHGGDGGGFFYLQLNWPSRAVQGHAGAAYNLANRYHRGAGVPGGRDDAEAAKWHLQAAEAGLPEVCYNSQLVSPPLPLGLQRSVVPPLGLPVVSVPPPPPSHLHYFKNAVGFPR